MVTIIFSGAATSMGKGGHIGVDLFLNWLPAHVRLAGIALLAVLGYSVQKTIPAGLSAPGVLMLGCFVLGVVAGVPIAFTLGISSMSFFIASPFLPFVFYSQQVSAGVDHFVLLSIPFFLLAGAAMEVNGMSSRLVELIVRCMGRLRGGLNMTIVVGIVFGRRVDVAEAYPDRMPIKQLIVGAGVGLVMVIMIGRGVMAGVATATEILAFAVVYAIVIFCLAFRELTLKATLRLFVDTATKSGMLLFFVAAATSLSYALTMEMIPQRIAASLVSLGTDFGPGTFLVLSIVMVAVFGAVLEGAPALIIFAPILVQIGIQLGFNPLHYATVLIIPMGLGLFSPPIRLGLYVTCAVCGVSMKGVIRPMFKYMVIITLGLFLIAFVPFLTVWLPMKMGYGL